MRHEFVLADIVPHLIIFNTSKSEYMMGKLHKNVICNTKCN